MMTAQDYLQYGLALLTFITSVVVVIKYLMDRDEKIESNLRLDTNKVVDEIRKEISEIKENYVRSEVHNRHAEAVERQIRDMNALVSNMSAAINVRLDNLFSLITNTGKK